MSEALVKLSAICPWPEERPSVENAFRAFDRLAEGASEILNHELSDDTRLILELGSWLGHSTRFIAERAPNAVVVGIDHWCGSPEDRRDPARKAMLPKLYETFLGLCWDYRSRLIPLRMTTLQGLRTVAEHGVKPDLIYVAESHGFESVAGELELIFHLFPQAVVAGGNYDRPGVAPALGDATTRHNLKVELVGPASSGRAWRLIAAKEEPGLAPAAVSSPDVERLVEAIRAHAPPPTVKSMPSSERLVRLPRRAAISAERDT